MSKIQLMSLRHSAFYTPYLMTMAGGFLKEQGLEYEYRIETPQHTVANSFLNGNCDVAQSAVATSFASLEKLQRPAWMHFAQINNRDGFFIASREPDLDFHWSKLQGKEVLVDHFFQPMAMFKYALIKNNVNYQLLQVHDAGDVNQIEQAFRDGKGDYVHMQGPVPQQLEYEEIGHVVASVGEAVGPVAFSSLCARPEWLQTDIAKVFVRAYKNSVNYVLEASPKELAAREQEAGFFTDINTDVLASTIKAYQDLGCWQADIDISRESYENLLEVFIHSGGITKHHAYNQVICAAPAD
jgi:NitT/TauT family transport system substrate-binding protein